jgi:hypothetical protein
MKKLILPENPGPALEEAAELITSFLDLLKAGLKHVVIQYRSFTGQYSGCCQDYVLPIAQVDTVYVNSAWIGFATSDHFYRTETITGRNAFVDWLKSQMDWLKKQVAFLKQQKTTGFTFDLPLITCPPHIEFIPARIVVGK